MTTSLALQRGAIEHLIALHDDDASTIIAAAKDGVRTLAWIERRQDLIRAIADLDRRAPAMAEILLAFPEARIVGIRDKVENEIDE